MEYTIGEVAKKTGLSISALRYYDKEGLLPLVERNEQGQRRYKDSDFEWLSIIECMKATGMTIREIRQYIDWYKEGDNTLEKRLELFRKQQEVLDARIEALKKNQYQIRCKIWYYEAAVAAGTESIHHGSCMELYEAHLKEKEFEEGKSDE